MTRRTLIFLDIDGTLLKPNYKPNSQKIFDTISRMSKLGFLFCLNSNRAWEDLVPLIKQFKINGPVIGEHGAFFTFNKRKQRLTKNPLPSTLIPHALQQLSAPLQAKIITTDTVNFPWTKLQETPLAWVMNKYRKYTASIHVRVRGKKNLKAAKQLAQLLRKKLPATYTIEVSPIFCNVLVNPKDCDKGTGLLKLKNTFFPKEKFIMIGDDNTDLNTLNIVDSFYAVGNATPKLKRISLFTATKHYTQGAQEILEHIQKSKDHQNKI